MTQYSIALCSRHFWPHVGPKCWWNMDFCRNLMRQGHRAMVFTQRANDQNPACFNWNGAQVIRTFVKPWNPFAIGQSFLSSSRHLGQALARCAAWPDCLLINDTVRESMVAIQFALRHRIPAVVRIDHDWTTAPGWGKAARQLKKLLRRQNVPIVFAANDPATKSQLSEFQDVELIEDGISLDPPAFDLSRDRLERRAIFRETHPILELQPNSRLALFVGPIPEGTQLVRLVQAWSQIRRDLPDSRFWISGNGRGEAEVWQEIVQRELNNEVLMIGQFECLDDLIQIADLFVIPEVSIGQQALARRYVSFAISRGIRVLCLDPHLRKQFGPSEPVSPGSESESESLVTLIRNGLSDLISGGRDSSEQVESVIDFRQTVRAYEDLMSRLVGTNRG